MPISYTVDTERRVILDTWSGTVTARDISDFWYRLSQDKRALAIRRSVTVLRDLEADFSEVDLFYLIRTVALPGLGDLKWTAAIVVEKRALRALKSQIRIFMQTFSRSMRFGDYPTALAWVLSQ